MESEKKIIKINEQTEDKFKEPEWMIILTKLIEKKPELIVSETKNLNTTIN